jgi:hypothetical protein
LIDTRSRMQLADALASVRKAAEVPTGLRSSVIPPNRGEVVGARAQMVLTEKMLRCGWPIAPRGAALVRIMLTDPAGPLYAPPSPGALKHHLCAVIDALDGVRPAA